MEKGQEENEESEDDEQECADVELVTRFQTEPVFEKAGGSALKKSSTPAAPSQSEIFREKTLKASAIFVLPGANVKLPE